MNGSWGNMLVFLGKTCSCCWGKPARAHVHLLMSDRGVGASASSCCSISDSGVMRDGGVIGHTILIPPWLDGWAGCAWGGGG